MSVEYKIDVTDDMQLLIDAAVAVVGDSIAKREHKRAAPRLMSELLRNVRLGYTAEVAIVVESESLPVWLPRQAEAFARGHDGRVDLPGLDVKATKRQNFLLVADPPLMVPIFLGTQVSDDLREVYVCGFAFKNELTLERRFGKQVCGRELRDLHPIENKRVLQAVVNLAAAKYLSR